MSGHLHCIAYREHYQLLHSLLHPAKVDQLYFLEEICRLLPIMTKNICLFLSNHHVRRHMCLVLSPIDLNLAGHQKHIQNMYQRDWSHCLLLVCQIVCHICQVVTTRHLAEFATFKCYAAVWWKCMHWPVEVESSMLWGSTFTTQNYCAS